MPSTVVHVGFAVLIAAAFLRDDFDAGALAVVAGFAVLPDLDTFVGLFIKGAHRTVFHNLVLPLAVALIVAYDVRVREDSFILNRWGRRGYRLSIVGVLGGWLVAQVFLDGFYNGANLLWPLHDEFIDMSGTLAVSDQRGVVQTFVELDGFSIADEHSLGTTGDTHYYTGVDPGPDAPPDAERYFPVFDNGNLAVVAVTGYVAAAYRLVAGE